MVKPNQVPNSETWPFLITLLSHCVSLEVSLCKKRLPKLMFVKTHRAALQRAEAGGMLFLLPAVRSLFTHILDISNGVPSLQSEYGVILRHLLSVPECRFHLRKLTYYGLVLLYMEKVEQSLSMKTDNQPCPREDVFRSVLKLHSLLDSHPGDFTDVNQCIVSGFVKIFNFVSDDGKVTRKLMEMECINIFLLKEGPNMSLSVDRDPQRCPEICLSLLVCYS